MWAKCEQKTLEALMLTSGSMNNQGSPYLIYNFLFLCLYHLFIYLWLESTNLIWKMLVAMNKQKFHWSVIFRWYQPLVNVSHPGILAVASFTIFTSLTCNNHRKHNWRESDIHDCLKQVRWGIRIIILLLGIRMA